MKEIHENVWHDLDTMTPDEVDSVLTAAIDTTLEKQAKKQEKLYTINVSKLDTAMKRKYKRLMKGKEVIELDDKRHLFYDENIYMELCDFIEFNGLSCIEATELIKDMEVKYSKDTVMLPDRHHIDCYYYDERKNDVEISEYKLALINKADLECWTELTDLPIFYNRHYEVHYIAFPEFWGWGYELKTVKVTFEK